MSDSTSGGWTYVQSEQMRYYPKSFLVEEAKQKFGFDDMTANVFIDKYIPVYVNLGGEDAFLGGEVGEFFPRIISKLANAEAKLSQKAGKHKLTTEEITTLIYNFKYFILGGSIMAGLYKYTDTSLGNCFVLTPPHDSYNGIMQTDQQIVNISKNRGGVGITLNNIRPRGSVIHNAAEESTGSVVFADRYARTIMEVSQSKGRRAAGLLSLDIDHPDAIEFINAKTNQDKLNGVNISVMVSDKAMDLIIDKPNKKSRRGVVRDAVAELIEEEGSYYFSIPKAKIREALNLVFKNATKYAEPGILFWDRMLDQIDATIYGRDGLAPVGTNPCGELPAPALSSCRLGSINLYAYVINPFTSEAEFDIERFRCDVYNAQRIMDDVIDLEIERIESKIIKLDREKAALYTRSKINAVEKSVFDDEIIMWKEVVSMARKERRTGLGVMGAADALAALGIIYASSEGINILDSITNEFAKASYMSSIDMAKERGKFPLCRPKDEVMVKERHPFIERIYKELSKEYQEKWAKYGRRNVQTMAIAPTGTISMMAGVSSGIEPVFSIRYKRRRRALPDSKNVFTDEQGNKWEEFFIIHKPFVEWYKIAKGGRAEDLYKMNDKEFDELVKESPYNKSTTYEIDPINKIVLQGNIQQHIDHSISITHNLPKGTTEEQVKELAKFAYEQKVKGFTVYVDGSRVGILVSKDEKASREGAPKRPKVLEADIHTTVVHGEPWVVLVGLYDKRPYEVFAFKLGDHDLKIDRGLIEKKRSKKYALLAVDGGVIVEDIIAEFETPEEEFGTRLISTALRHGADMKFIYEQLNKSKGDITHFSKAISRVLKKYVKAEDLAIEENSCPVCKSTNLSMKEGCLQCLDCGWSKCS